MSGILIIGYLWPEPASSAAGRRMIELVELFQTQNAKITFASPAAKSEFAINLKAKDIDEVVIELNNESFDVFIEKLQPDIVLFDRFMMEEQFGWRVAKKCPNAIRILDTEDLHCLRKARQLALRENRIFNTADLFIDIAKREIASIYRCDLSLIISKIEMNVLKDIFKVPSYLIHYLPFLIKPIDKEDQNKWIDYHERAHFIMIGNFLHEPNWDAVLYLKNKIWPLIRKQLPDAEIHIYGAYASSKVMQLDNPKTGFCVKGRAENVNEVMGNAKVCIAPLRFGAGLKGKFIDAMENGTPSITTAIGAEGMHEKLPWSGYVEDAIDTMVDAAVKLYTDKSEWLMAQQNGITIINQCYDKEKRSEKFIDILTKLRQNSKDYRIQNFTGSMLMHHTMNSTKYMAKWIEEKNKPN